MRWKGDWNIYVAMGQVTEFIALPETRSLYFLFFSFLFILFFFRFSLFFPYFRGGAISWGVEGQQTRRTGGNSVTDTHAD